jgi:solute carrier family 25 (mitochondrial phosphate transporter), member 23/24/25/41
MVKYNTTVRISTPADSPSPTGLLNFTEFKVFVEHAEKELRQLFESIDRDHNGELDKSELKSAFRRAGLAISSAKLDQFFDEVDVNHDGVISFDEWR